MGQKIALYCEASDLMECMPLKDEAPFAAEIWKQVNDKDELIRLIGVKDVLDNISDEEIIAYLEEVGYKVSD